MPWVVAVVAVIRYQDKILAMRRAAEKDAGPGLWETLSGRVEPGEQPFDAVVREAREESGLAVDFDPMPATAYVAARLGAPMLVVGYVGEARGRAVVMSDEHDAYAWVTPAEFGRLTSLTLLAEAVQAVVAAAGRRDA